MLTATLFSPVETCNAKGDVDGSCENSHQGPGFGDEVLSIPVFSYDYILCNLDHALPSAKQVNRSSELKMAFKQMFHDFEGVGIIMWQCQRTAHYTGVEGSSHPSETPPALQDRVKTATRPRHCLVYSRTPTSRQIHDVGLHRRGIDGFFRTPESGQLCVPLFVSRSPFFPIFQMIQDRI